MNIYMEKQLPYVQAYDKIGRFFECIKSAAVPTKVTYRFIEGVLLLRSSSYRPMIPLLKELGFVDSDTKPTSYYQDYISSDKPEIVMADRVRKAYASLFQIEKRPNLLEEKKLVNLLRKNFEGDTETIELMAGTFLALVQLSQFDEVKPEKKETKKTVEMKPQNESPLPTPPKVEEKKKVVEQEVIPVEQPAKMTIKSEDKASIDKKFGISYTINLNLPATTDIGVYNSIFKALKNHLLDE